MSEKMSAERPVARALALSGTIRGVAQYGNMHMVGITDAEAIEDAIAALQSEADGLRKALVEHREFWRGHAHGFESWQSWRDLEEMTDAALNGSPQATALEDKQ